MSDENNPRPEDNLPSEFAIVDTSERPLPAIKSSPKTRVFEIVGTVVLAGLATILFDSGYHVFGDVCVFLAILCGIYLVAIYLKGHGFKNVTQWSTVAGIAVAVFVILFAHGPSATNTGPTEMLSKPNAEDVMQEYENAIPMRQASVASGFNGLPVIWMLSLRKANGEKGTVHLVLIANHNGIASSDIRMDVPEKGNEFLKVANKGDTFVVKGSISAVSDNGIDLALGGTILPTK